MAAPKRFLRNKIAIDELVERLEAIYGPAPAPPRQDPVDELICCILTQHTNDNNAFLAFDRLREVYPTWDEVVEAGQDKVAEVVRVAGLANQKARAIVACLRQIKLANGSYDLDALRGLPPLEAREKLLELPGVGPKTASIVLSFTMNMDVLAVDTHVYRVSWRLGLIHQELGEAKAHDELLPLMPPGYAYRFHMALIRHGRTVCKAPVPWCDRCTISDLCRWYKRGGPAKHKAKMEKLRAQQVRSRKPKVGS